MTADLLTDVPAVLWLSTANTGGGHTVSNHIWLMSSSICILLYINVDQPNSVGTGTYYGLDGPGIESHWCETFPGSHPASYTIGTGSFQGG
jgi:hypothetical protein